LSIKKTQKTTKYESDQREDALSLSERESRRSVKGEKSAVQKTKKDVVLGLSSSKEPAGRLSGD